jgi:hypothetical protein
MLRTENGHGLWKNDGEVDDCDLKAMEISWVLKMFHSTHLYRLLMDIVSSRSD